MSTILQKKIPAASPAAAADRRAERAGSSPRRRAKFSARKKNRVICRE